MPAVPENRIKNAPAARRAAVKKTAQKTAQAERGAAAAQKPPGAYVLIGESYALAVGTAEHEWGWKSGKAKGLWIDPNGNTVRFVPDVTALAKLVEKTDGPIAVYRGYRWYAAIAPHHLDRHVVDGVVTVMPDPTPDVPAA